MKEHGLSHKRGRDRTFMYNTLCRAFMYSTFCRHGVSGSLKGGKVVT